MLLKFWINLADYFEEPLVWLFVILAIVLIIVFYALTKSLMVLTHLLHPEKVAEKKQVAVAVKKTSAVERLMKRLTRSVPVEKEKDVLLDHDYDGIRELDNQLPPWWIWGFYITIVMAVVYMFVYHLMGDGHVMQNEYAAELQEAEQLRAERMKNAAENINFENVIALTDAQELAIGKSTFDKFCVACHGNAGQGNVGPNLTDEFWLHGGGIKNVFHTITEGVPAKGMIPWKAQLTPKQIQEVSSFILTLKGTNPAGAKEPQGDKWIEPSDSARAMLPAKEPDAIAAK